MRDDELGIDTMGLQDEPDPGEPEPTPWDRIKDMLPTLRLVVSEAAKIRRIDGMDFDVELSAERPDESPEWVDLLLRVSVEHSHDPNNWADVVLLKVLDRIVKEAKAKGLLR